MAAGYEVLVDNSKRDAILKVEGICPVCGHYPSRYIEVTYPDNSRQFKYTCPECESRWQGNLYDSQLRMFDPGSKLSIFKSHGRKGVFICWGA